MEKWIVCKKCGHHYSNRLRRCPECGQRTLPGLKQILPASLIAAAVIAAATGFALGLNDKGAVKTAPDTVSASEPVSPSLPSGTVTSGESSASPSSADSESVTADVSSEKKAPSGSEKKVSPSGGKKPSSSAASAGSDNKTVKLPSESHSSNLQEAVASTQDKGETVEVTLSPELVSLINDSAEGNLLEPDETDRKYGIISVTENSDGSVTAVFEKDGYYIYKADLRAEIQNSIAEIKNIPELSFIKAIDCDEEFDKITIMTENYNSDTESGLLDTAVWGVGASAYLYKAFIGAGDTPITIEAIDTVSGKSVIKTQFPG